MVLEPECLIRVQTRTRSDRVLVPAMGRREHPAHLPLTLAAFPCYADFAPGWIYESTTEESTASSGVQGRG